MIQHNHAQTIPEANILVVDDDQINLDVFVNCLKDIPGLRLYPASSGRAALEMIKEREYAVILLDVSMPGLDGYQTASRIRENENARDVPILFVTAFCQSEAEVAKGYEAGGADYLFKPVHMRMLRSKVQVFVNLYRKRLALAQSLELVNRRNSFIRQLLSLTTDILNMEEFAVTAKNVFTAAKEATGAAAGYVALLSPNGHELKVLLLDSGGRACNVDPRLPMPIRGLRAEAYATGKPVFDNAFMDSEWTRLMPEGHVELDNVLFAPLWLDDHVAGVIGLANKPGPFTEEDARMAAAFGDLGAIALRNARMLEELRESRRDLDRAQAIAHIGSFKVDAAYGESSWSENLREMLGVSGSDAPFGREDFLSLVDERDRLRVREAMDEAASCAGLRQVEFSLAPEQGRERRFLMRLDCGGDAGTLFGTCQDITERKQREAKALLSRRLEAIGSLAGGVAHEINTPIQYLGDNLEYVGAALETLLDIAWGKSAPDTTREDRLPEYRRELPLALADMRDGLKRVAGIVRILLTLSPPVRQGRRQVDLNALLQGLADITLGERKASIETRLALDPELPQVTGAPEELGQLFLNLLINACQAIEERPEGPLGGVVTVRTIREKDMAAVVIEDNGPGIPDDLKASIFDPFFSARRMGRGTGQELTLAKAVAENHGGAITVSSRLGAGTIFTVRLPYDGGGGDGGES